MKKKLLFIAGIFAVALFAPNANAASAPKYYENFANSKEIFFANGTPITIEERTDSQPGALIKWEGGEQLVTEEVGVFGGYHDDTTEKVDTSITMNGGTVRNIIGGGLHASEVGKATITLNGGTIKVAIYGGGYDGYVWGGTHCTCSSATNAAKPSNESTVRVDEVEIEVNGGSVTYVIGGGGGYNYVGFASVTINDLDNPANYVVAGGTNGYTGYGEVNVNGGEIETVKGAMRGTVDEVEIAVTDGKVNQVFAAAPSEANDENATVNKTTVVIEGGEIAAIGAGTSGETNEPITGAELIYQNNVLDEEILKDSGFEEENVTTTIKFTIVVGDEVEEGLLEKGYQISEEEIKEMEDAIKELLEDTNLEFKGFFADEDHTKEFDFSKPLEEDTTLYIALVEIQEKEEDTPVEEPKEEEKEETNNKVNPDTSDINVIALIITLLVGGLGLSYTIKNRKFN